MTTIEHSIDIAASPSVVWALNTDPVRWPDLTPTVTSVRWQDDGPLRVGRVAVVKQPGQRAAAWTVTALEPETRFVWQATVYGVTTVATHLIEAAPQGCRNTLRLELSGRGSRLMGALLGRKLRSILRTEAEGFRRAAEGVTV